MKWRLRSWKPESHFSTVEIDIEQNRDDTTLKMKQKKVPSSAVDTTKQGWKASFISFSVVYFFLGGYVNITSCSVETRQSGLPCSWQPLTLTKEQVIPSYPHKTHVRKQLTGLAIESMQQLSSLLRFSIHRDDAKR